MSSLPFLTSELQALAKEAGRKHADVKEAADKALALLKSSPESALSDLYEAPTAPGKHPVLLTPIVLGCGTRNPKVISIAVSGLQRLTGVRGAITQATVPTILTTLRSVLSQGVEIQLKILQTLVSLLTNCKDVHDDLLAETLLISFKLLESKIGVVSSTAAATLRQLVMFVFENVDEEDRFAKSAKENPAIAGPIPTEFSVDLPSPLLNDNDRDSTQPYYLLPAARDAYLVFDDICLLINGEQPSFLKLQSLPRTFGLELVESVLSDFSSVFVNHPELLHLLRTLLSPLLIRALAEKPSFSTTLRLMRVMYLLLKKFNDHLIMESEIFLCMFIKIVAPGDVEGSGGHPLSSSMLPSLSKDGGKLPAGSAQSSNHGSSPPWMRVLALEILRGLCGDFELLSKVWTRYDAASEQSSSKASASSGAISVEKEVATTASVFRSMITALNKLATEKPALLGTGTAVIAGVPAEASSSGEYSVGGMVDGIVGMAQQAATSVGVAGLSQGSLTVVTASVKLQCIDQLDKADAPAIPDTYVFLLALQCLNAIAEGFAASTLPTYSSIMNSRPRQGEEPLPAPPALDFARAPEDSSMYKSLRTARDMADAAWPALLASLSFFISTNLDDDLFSYTLSAFQQFSTTCGVLALTTPRDALLISLCKFAVPPPIISTLASSETAGGSTQSRPPLNSVLSAGADALGLSGQHVQPMCLSTRNLLCLRSLIHVAQTLAGSLEKTWFYVFEALQNADLVVRAEAARRQKKRSVPPTGAGPTSPAKASTSVSSSLPSGTASSQSPLARYLPNDQEEQAAQTRATRLFEASKALDDDAFRWFVAALCRLNAEMVGMPIAELGELAGADPTVMSPQRKDHDPSDDYVGGGQKLPKRSGINVIRTLRPGEKSYAVTKLGAISLMNMLRLISRPASVAWDLISGHLLLVQHWQQAPAIVRLQSAEVFDKIAMAAPAEALSMDPDRQQSLQDQVFDALARQCSPQGRNQTSTDIDIRQTGLNTLFQILESQGHALVCGWTSIFEILKSACPVAVSSATGDQAVSLPVSSTTTATSAKASQLVKVAFPSLQLICSDFLAALSVQETEKCISTLTAFGRQHEDINVALTAGNLLWQVSDHLQASRRHSDQGEEYLQQWMYLLKQLLQLSADARQEVRDGAIQILWRSIELYGASISEEHWESCLWDVIFPLLGALNNGLALAETEKSVDNAERMAMGTPSLSKQWDDSKILALTSAGSVFANELPTEICRLPSFEKAGAQFVDYAATSFQRGRPSVATAAAKAIERICAIEWPEDRVRQARHLATTVWDAWVQIGDWLYAGDSQSITQPNLEAYSKVLMAIQRHGHLDLTEERCQTLLTMAKTILTYPYSPEYRPDRDVMTAVQANVLDIITQIPLSSSMIVAEVLSDLAEYMSLAYRHISDAIKSLSLTSTPRNQQQTVTYVAVSKKSATRILEIYDRFRTNPAIYDTAVESLLAAYSIPLKLKYDCPASSRFGDDPPLWKTATLQFLQLAKTVSSILPSLDESISSGSLSKVWMRVIGGFQAILQADCRSVLDLSPDEQRAEEDFDLAVIVTLEVDILPRLADPKVPAEVITTLGRALIYASRLHEPQIDETSTKGSKPKGQNGYQHCEGNDGNSTDNSACLATLPSEEQYIGTTIEDVELPRERFAYWCLELLFLMCGKDTGSKRVSTLVTGMLFKRSQVVLRSYLADAAIRGKVPFSRVRQEELCFVLSRLRRLQLEEGVFEATFAQEPKADIVQPCSPDSVDHQVKESSVLAALASAARRSTRAHLFELYPDLLALLSSARLHSDRDVPYSQPYASLDFAAGATPAGSGSIAGVTVSEHLSAHALVRQCLEVLGQSFTLAGS